MIRVIYKPAQNTGWLIDIIVGDFVHETYTPLNHVIAQRVARGALDLIYREHPEWKRLPIEVEGLPETTEQ